MHDPTEHRFTKFDEQQLRKSLQYKSTSELREKLANVTLRQSMAKKSVTELKQDLKDMRAAETPGQRHPNYPQLPQKMYDSQSRSWKVVDREYLLSLDAFRATPLEPFVWTLSRRQVERARLIVHRRNKMSTKQTTPQSQASAIRDHLGCNQERIRRTDQSSG